MTVRVERTGPVTTVVMQDGLVEGDALANELRHGLVSLETDAAAGAARFVSGAGRHGDLGGLPDR